MKKTFWTVAALLTVTLGIVMFAVDLNFCARSIATITYGLAMGFAHKLLVERKSTPQPH